MAHQRLQGLLVARFQRALHIVQTALELANLLNQGAFVGEKQFAPQRLVDVGNAGEVPKGIARVIHKVFVRVGVHQADGNGMRQLADVANHLIVLFTA